MGMIATATLAVLMLLGFAAIQPRIRKAINAGVFFGLGVTWPEATEAVRLGLKPGLVDSFEAFATAVANAKKILAAQA